MPPADPYLAAGVVGGGGAAANPLTTVESFAKIQNELNTARLFNQTFGARQQMGEIAATSGGDLDMMVSRILSSPAAPFAGEFVNSVRTMQKTQTDLANARQTGAESAVSFLLKNSAAGMDPAAWDKTIKMGLSTVDPMYRPAVQSAMESYRDALTTNLPQDPVMAKRVYNYRLSGILLGSGMSAGDIHELTGTQDMAGLGGVIQPGVRAPAALGGGFYPGGPALPISPAPRVGVEPLGPGGAPAVTQLGGVGGAGGVGAPMDVGGGLMANPLTPAQSTTAPPSAAPSAAIGLTPGERTYSEARGKDVADYQKALDERVNVGDQILMTVSEGRQALSSIRAGGGAAAYARLATIAQSVGASNEVVDKIAGGNLAAAQEFEKLMVNTTMGQIRQQLQGIGGSRLSQLEFETFQHNNPNINTDPRAIDKIFNFWNRVANRDYEEQQALNAEVGKPGFNMATWPARWQRVMREKGMVSGTTSAAGSQAGGEAYSSPSDVAAAYKAGHLTRDAASRILRDQFKLAPAAAAPEGAR